MEVSGSLWISGKEMGIMPFFPTLPPWPIALRSVSSVEEVTVVQMFISEFSLIPST